VYEHTLAGCAPLCAGQTPDPGEDLDQKAIEAELDDIVEEFCARWVGPAKKPPAEACPRTRCAPPR
jgi:hypothetical protein